MNGWLLRVRMCHVGEGAVVSQLGFPFAPMVTQPPGITGFSGIFGGSSDPTTLFLAFLLAGTLWLVPRLGRSSTRKLPPGPRGLPLIGDILHIANQDWLASPQRKDDYGENSMPLIPHKITRSCTVQVA